MHEGKVIPACAALVSVALLVIWWTQTPVVQAPPRVNPADLARLKTPGKRRTTAPATSGPAAVALPAGGKVERFRDAPPSDVTASWPQFRGPMRDGICRSTVPLKRSWAQPPKVLWSREVGEGHAGPAMLDGKIYLADYDDQAKRDVIRCLSLADGGDIWAYSYPMEVKRDHGMSRTVPVVTRDFIVSLGPRGQVTCLNTPDGSPRWQIDLVAQYGTKIPRWHAGQCPLVDGERVILAPAGTALLIAVDIKTGKVLQQTPNPNGWLMTHCSITPMTFAGRKMYIYPASRATVGVDAETFEVLWQVDWAVRMANVPAPVVVGEDRILLSADYDAGAMMIQLASEGGRIVARTLFKREMSEFSARHHTPILYDGYLYSIRQDTQLACMAPDGEVKWASGDKIKFGRGLGPFLIATGPEPSAGGLIYVMNETGLLALAQASPDGCKVLGTFQAVTHKDPDGTIHAGHDAWAPMALVDGRLLLRDLTRMVCLDVRP